LQCVNMMGRTIAGSAHHDGVSMIPSSYGFNLS
jgi:hypothetical protein